MRGILCEWNKNPKWKQTSEVKLWTHGSNAVVRQSLMRRFRVLRGNHLLDLTIPGNASQPLKWKSVYQAHASTESDHGDSALVKEWNDSSVMAVHSQEKNSGTIWLHTYNWTMYLWTLWGKYACNRRALCYRICSFIYKKNQKKKPPHPRPGVNIDSDSKVR